LLPGPVPAPRPPGRCGEHWEPRGRAGARQHPRPPGAAAEPRARPRPPLAEAGGRDWLQGAARAAAESRARTAARSGTALLVHGVIREV